MNDESKTTVTVVVLENAHRLNDARDAVDEIRNAVGHTHGDGRLAEACDAADMALFRVLNIAKSYVGAPLTNEVLHNKKREPFGG